MHHKLYPIISKITNIYPATLQQALKERKRHQVDLSNKSQTVHEIFIKWKEQRGTNRVHVPSVDKKYARWTMFNNNTYSMLKIMTVHLSINWMTFAVIMKRWTYKFIFLHTVHSSNNVVIWSDHTLQTTDMFILAVAMFHIIRANIYMHIVKLENVKLENSGCS